jgi:hypothetical protein
MGKSSRSILKEFKEFGAGYTIGFFLIIFGSTIVFNVFHFDDSNIIHLTGVMGMPLFLFTIIYMYIKMKRKK